MRTLHLCLFLSLLPAIASGQDCDPNTCPSITCSGSASPVCTESGYWVCSCTTSGDDTCYNASDCGGEDYSCEDNCCVDNVGCTQGACMYASDCGFDASSWTCPDGCCIAVSSGGGSSGGGCGGSCQTDNDCPGCDGCSGGTCVDDDSYCSSNMTCQQSECCYDNGGCVVVYGGTCNGDSGECGGPYSCGGCVEEGGSCGWDCDCITGGCLCGACSDSDADIVCDFSPQQLLVDLSGAGFSLTSARDGVKFDFLGNGNARQMAWTAAGSNAGWLVLDRNGNGQIDNGAELFSNVSPQPDPAPRGKLGFRALAVYDLPANGGNGDGVIDQRDAVFSRLLVWVDRNHNGVADPGELLTMQQAGIQSISLRYKPSTRTDAHGNRLGLRSNVTRTAGQPAGPRYVYEVTLVTEDSPLQR